MTGWSQDSNSIRDCSESWDSPGSRKENSQSKHWTSRGRGWAKTGALHRGPAGLRDERDREGLGGDRVWPVLILGRVDKF